MQLLITLKIYNTKTNVQQNMYKQEYAYSLRKRNNNKTKFKNHPICSK